MNPKTIIQSGESQTVEFKESFDREAIETVGAFANTKGGIIFIGVANNGTIPGFSVGKETAAEWSNQISQSTEPTVIPEIQIEKIEGKTVLLITINEYPLKPVAYRGRCYKRVGSSNRQMSPQEIAQMHLQSTGNSWDALPATASGTGVLDSNKIRYYIQAALILGRRRFSENDNPLNVLKKLDLIKEDRPTWAALLLFGHNPQAPLTQATVHCGRFKKNTKIIDDHLIAGTIMEQIDEVMNFIRKHINVEFVISGNPQRDEIWDYPLQALREAVINSICHRDYSDPADIQIKIFDDSLQLWNPGGLPFDWTIDDLLDPSHSSKPRNKLIAQIFYDIGFIERYGSGIQRMISDCAKAGLPQPVFKEKFGGLSITFQKNIFNEGHLKELGLNKRQIKAVRYVVESRKITNNDYQRINDCSRNTATNDLKDLTGKGILKESGKKGAGSYYFIAQ